MANEPDLVGKKKIVVDESAFVNLYRSPVDKDKLAGEYLAANYARAHMFGGSYFPMDPAVDKVRAFLGKSWDHRKEQPPADATTAASAVEAQTSENPTEKLFKNNWEPVRCFGNTLNTKRAPLQLVMCNEQETLTLNPKPDTLSLGGLHYSPGIKSIEDKIILRCQGEFRSIETNADGDSYYELEPNQVEWSYFMKTGISMNGATYAPVVDTSRFFYDHYHETYLPFTPDEALNKQPVGKAYFADYKTSYNEVLRSGRFENLLSYRDDIQNSIPSPYGFLKLINNKNLLEDESLNLNAILKKITPYYTSMKKDVYVNLLAKYPLETLTTLYGVVGTEAGMIPESKVFIDYPLGKSPEDSKLIEKIINLNYDKIDVTGLFESYIDIWTVHTLLPDFGEKPKKNMYGHINALENKFRNLVFSPNVIPIMNKVEKYKKYFPFSLDLEFNAKLITELGDSMKKYFLTQPMSYILSSRYSRFLEDPEQEAFHQDILFLDDGQYAPPMNFIDYTQEDIYKTTTDGLEMEYSISPYRSEASLKNAMNLAAAFWTWSEKEDFHPENNDGTLDSTDIRSYTTFFNNDVDEPINIDEKPLFKKLFGSVFYGKIASMYNQKCRTYEDILNGIPAHAEDLFYRIKKERKFTTEGAQWEVVQNVLIPNTSDLDIVKYVDTQLKYSSDATYKYTVYTERVVFGSAYRYHWPSAGPAPRNLPPESFPQYGPATPPDPMTIGASLSYPSAAEIEEWIKDTTKDDVSGPAFDLTPETNYTATLYVRVHPSIQVIEDILFETPEVFVMDRPPVRPDVNILPYRAINNRIKILLTGNVDRSREEPVIMLGDDVAEFDKIKKSQLVVDTLGNPLKDGKVEFASDDSVAAFQIFRTEEKPKKYSDFTLYREINNFVFEEKILPNTKYYYTFRAKDPHNHVSNPTEVYEVELIDEKGAVKPIIRLVSMKPPENKTNIKACQKYIYIKPSLRQLYFSDDPDVDGIFSDITKKKKYKIRLTSKGSGKKIDINFSFRKKHTE